jgi:hypothetical protein
MDRSPRPRHLWATLLILGVCGPARARPPVSATGIEALGARSCKALFGDRQLRAKHAKQRAKQLDWVREDEDGVTVAHMEEGWGEEPVRLTVRGTRLAGVRGSTALFQLSAARAAAVGCPAGTYALGVDHALGRHVQILAVLSRGVLVEHRGQLGFISAPGVRDPRWLVAWRLRAEVPFALTFAHRPAAPLAPYNRRSYRYNP